MYADVINIHCTAQRVIRTMLNTSNLSLNREGTSMGRPSFAPNREEQTQEVLSTSQYLITHGLPCPQVGKGQGHTHLALPRIGKGKRQRHLKVHLLLTPEKGWSMHVHT